METCCETDASSQAHDHIDDPTLAGCCLRDLKEQAYNQHLLQRLAECDVSEARQRMEAGVIRHRLQDIPEQVSDVDSLATDSDDDGDHIFAECQNAFTCQVSMATTLQSRCFPQDSGMQSRTGCLSFSSKPGFEHLSRSWDWDCCKTCHRMLCRFASCSFPPVLIVDHGPGR